MLKRFPLKKIELEVKKWPKNGEKKLPCLEMAAAPDTNTNHVTEQKKRKKT